MKRPIMILCESVNALAFVAVGLCLCSMLVLFRWQDCQKKKAVAPGPPAWPILGHLHLITNDQPLHQTLWSLAQRYGPIMHLQLGCRPVLVVSSSDLARECLTTYDKIFASRPTSAAGEHLAYGNTVLSMDPYGPRWRNLRRICTTELLSPARIDMTKHIRTEEVSKMVRSLFHSSTLSHKGMIGAATGTSARAAEWALSAVIKHPEVCKKAQQELDAKVGSDRVVEESDLPRLEYLRAVVKETLRLYPGAPLLIPHLSTEACSVGGYYVPAGTRLLVNAWAIHRDAAAWESPLQFEPSRFLNESIDFKGKDFKYLPFGRGRRACPGAALAMDVVGLSLARLLQGFDWSVEGAVDMSEGIGLGLGRAVPLEAAIRPRLPNHLY